MSNNRKKMCIWIFLYWFNWNISTIWYLVVCWNSFGNNYKIFSSFHRVNILILYIEFLGRGTTLFFLCRKFSNYLHTKKYIHSKLGDFMSRYTYHEQVTLANNPFERPLRLQKSLGSHKQNSIQRIFPRKNHNQSAMHVDLELLAVHLYEWNKKNERIMQKFRKKKLFVCIYTLDICTGRTCSVI